MTSELMQFVQAYLWAVSPVIFLMALAGLWLVISERKER